MTIGILIFSNPTEEQHSCSEMLEEAIIRRGHVCVKIYEPFLTFQSCKDKITIKHQANPLPILDVIICRPNFISEPSLHLYAPEIFALNGYRVINGLSAIKAGKNKIAQHIAFEKNKIPCPRWGVAQKSEDVVALANEIGYPVVLKVAFGTHGKGVFFTDKQETLKPIADYLAVRDRNPIIVEEYIAEAKRKDLRVFIVCGKIVAAMERSAPDGDVRANTSNGGIGSPVELNEKEADLALRAAKLFDLEIAGVDIIRSNRGPLLLEVNANPGFKELEKATGVDVAGAIVDYVAKI